MHWRGFQLGSGGSQESRHTTLKWLNPASAPTALGRALLRHAGLDPLAAPQWRASPSGTSESANSKSRRARTSIPSVLRPEQAVTTTSADSSGTPSSRTNVAWRRGADRCSASRSSKMTPSRDRRRRTPASHSQGSVSSLWVACASKAAWRRAEGRACSWAAGDVKPCSLCGDRVPWQPQERAYDL